MTSTTKTKLTAQEQAEILKERAKVYRENIRTFMEDNDNPGMVSIALIMLCVLGAIGLKLLWNNVSPFVVVLGGKMIMPSHIPVVGWGVDALTVIYTFTGAFIAWALCQFAELFWIVVMLDNKAKRQAQKISTAERTIQDAENKISKPDRRMRKIQKQARSIPFFFQGASGFIALIGFVVEVAVNSKAYPLITDWSRFIAGISLMKLEGVDFNNFWIQFFNLFSTELLAIAILATWQWLTMHKGANN